MAQLKFNNTLWRIILGLGPYTSRFNYSTNQIVSPDAIYIMSGPMPSASEINTMSVSKITGTGAGQYGNQRLATFTGGTNFVSTDNSASVADSGIVVASGTGIASWVVVALTSGSRLLVGDVSDTYGSAFLLINDVNINAGERYKILSMQFSMNHEYTI